MARGMKGYLKSLNSNLVIFPRVGEFEQLFGPGRGEFEQKFSKNSNARGVARGVARGGGGRVLKLRFDWYIISCETWNQMT